MATAVIVIIVHITSVADGRDVQIWTSEWASNFGVMNHATLMWRNKRGLAARLTPPTQNPETPTTAPKWPELPRDRLPTKENHHACLPHLQRKRTLPPMQGLRKSWRNIHHHRLSHVRRQESLPDLQRQRPKVASNLTSR